MPPSENPLRSNQMFERRKLLFQLIADLEKKLGYSLRQPSTDPKKTTLKLVQRPAGFEKTVEDICCAMAQWFNKNMEKFVPSNKLSAIRLPTSTTEYREIKYFEDNQLCTSKAKLSIQFYDKFGTNRAEIMKTASFRLFN